VDFVLIDTPNLVKDATMTTISKPVGKLSPGTAGNLTQDVLAVQKLINGQLLKLTPIARLKEDGIVGQNTVRAIEEFQRRVVRMPIPDGRIDPGGATWRELNLGSSATNSNPQFYFPFSSLPSASWTSPPRSFASNRSNGTRAHAGCDLYFPSGTWIHAIAAGTVVKGPYLFYACTYAIEIDHGTFLARYGEVQANTLVSAGSSVTAGQRIAKVGHLVGISVPSDMLHLELYSKAGSGPLTVSAPSSKKRSDGIPFLRRNDLLDPTSYLNTWKNNLPPS